MLSFGPPLPTPHDTLLQIGCQSRNFLSIQTRGGLLDLEIEHYSNHKIFAQLRRVNIIKRGIEISILITQIIWNYIYHIYIKI
jgi:hypothetical protein